MSQDESEWSSLWDEVTSEADFDWDSIIGEPPEWYYPLVGRVAVATGGLERRLAEAALKLLAWPQARGGDLTFWSSSSGRLRTLLDAARGLSSEFDGYASELPAASAMRNKIVHVATGWHDWEEPLEPSGWHYLNPKDGNRVYLDNRDTRPAMEAALAVIEGLDGRVWGFNLRLSQQDQAEPESK